MSRSQPLSPPARSLWCACQSIYLVHLASFSFPSRRVIRFAVGAVKLWWPNTVADAARDSHSQPLRPPPSQPLYPLTLTITLPFSSSSLKTPALSDTRNIGFRAFALVTDDDTDPQRLLDMKGSGNVTMRFKVNGVAVWARGSNVIPLDEFNGRTDAAALIQVVPLGTSLVRRKF